METNKLDRSKFCKIDPAFFRTQQLKTGLDIPRVITALKDAIATLDLCASPMDDQETVTAHNSVRRAILDIIKASYVPQTFKVHTVHMNKKDMEVSAHDEEDALRIAKEKYKDDPTFLFSEVEVNK